METFGEKVTHAYLAILRREYPRWDLGQLECGHWLALTKPTPTSEIAIVEPSLIMLGLSLDSLALRRRAWLP